MRSHLLSESFNKGLCGVDFAHDIKDYEIIYTLSGSLRHRRLLQYSVCCHLSFANRWQPFGWSEPVITIPDDNKQPLEYFAAKYQMGLSNMLEANPGWTPICRKAVAY